MRKITRERKERDYEKPVTAQLSAGAELLGNGNYLTPILE